MQNPLPVDGGGIFFAIEFWTVEIMKAPFDIAADLDTPVSAFRKLAPFKPHFLLESVEGGERLGRYSFIGFGEGLLSAQQVILFGIVTVALLFLLLNYLAIIFEDRAAALERETEVETENRRLRLRALWRNNIVMTIAMGALLALYLLVNSQNSSL